ncbi:hypothetical protein GCM10007424_04310 [Flavobacterium suaedae]|uniref:Lipoprotein n=1 Tax=Flavobacterium suaedae TaxID=1767027 RepID=A0ABQ1JIY3_9FLAO|nr:hypothetical protein [Flavobacterium suaedae]GGB67463.1 hypothetical protein GCM10007424_04310 [Flavobacterium suaedae]
MKQITIYLILLVLVSCNKVKNIDENKDEIIKENDSEVSVKPEIKKEIIIREDTLRISERVFYKYQQYFDEINDGFIKNPETTYLILSGCCIEGYEDLRYEFTSEAGQDVYYVLYSHFLKQKNAEEEYKEERENLIKIFQYINSIYGSLNYGGTYFGHQMSRIYGKVEYSVYLYKNNKDVYEKKYKIDKQKKLYIDRLRQLVLDEEKHDFNTLGEEKTKRREELMTIINQLNILITNYFYLKEAQKFEHSNYYISSI